MYSIEVLEFFQGHPSLDVEKFALRKSVDLWVISLFGLRLFPHLPHQTCGANAKFGSLGKTGQVTTVPSTCPICLTYYLRFPSTSFLSPINSCTHTSINMLTHARLLLTRSASLNSRRFASTKVSFEATWAFSFTLCLLQSLKEVLQEVIPEKQAQLKKLVSLRFIGSAVIC
jgi:hypothetical protein